MNPKSTTQKTRPKTLPKSPAVVVDLDAKLDAEAAEGLKRGTWDSKRLFGALLRPARKRGRVS